MKLYALPFCLCVVSLATTAQTDRVTSMIDVNQSFVLNGSVPSQAQSQVDRGAVDPSMRLPYILLRMKPSPAQQVQLEKLLNEQQDSDSPNYHRWLTPESYADRFGLSRADMKRIGNWLRSHGFTVVNAARGRDWIAVSGSVALAENTFHTQIHRYSVDGESHFANATEISIPKALQGIVAGVRGLDDFRWKPAGLNRIMASRPILPAILHPHYSVGPSGPNFLAPDDFATIYDLTSLYNSGIDGTGMKLVVVGQVSVVMADIQAFRSGVNLPAKNPVVTIVPGTTPGNNPGDLLESDLDLEWSGAVARNATVLFVTSEDVFESAIYAIDNDLAPIISMSYGGCERKNGGFIAANEPTMQKANAEGITFLASSGDSGPASCDPPGGSGAGQGLAVSYPASSPEVTGVGGTEFSGDVNNIAQYWDSSNGPNGGSAISYIPETSWNDTVERGTIAATGGGKSSCHASPCAGGFPKPTWQTGTGVPNDSVRDVPDISFSGSPDHDGYIICSTGSCNGGLLNGNFEVVGGTSASTPVFAGILALLNQQLGNQQPTGLGNVNPRLYRLAQTPANNVFHDVATGDNIVPCIQGSANCPASPPFQYGFSTTAGFDLVTGLGSIDVGNLLSSWNTGKIGTTSALNASPSTIGLGSTQPLTLKATVSPDSGGGTPNGSVTFFLNGTIPLGSMALSSGSASLNYNPKSLKAGQNSFTVSYGGNANYINSQSTAETVTVQDFTLSLSSNPTTVTIASPGSSGKTTLTVTPQFNYADAVSFTCTGLPSEATCSANDVTPNGGAVMSTLTITTTAPSAALHSPFQGRALFYAVFAPGLLGLAWLPFAKRARSRNFRLLALMICMVGITLWLPACGGGGGAPATPSNPGTPAGTMTVTVTATGNGGAPVHSAQLTLTVK